MLMVLGFRFATPQALCWRPLRGLSHAPQAPLDWLMNQNSFFRLGAIRDVEVFRDYLQQHHISIPCDAKLLAGDTSPLGQPLRRDGISLGNRFAIQPMEGWD